MIEIYESSSFVAQHQLTLSLLCLIGVVLSLSVFITASSFVLQKKRFIKHSKAIVSISLGILIISSCLLFAISAKGPHYSGSAEYTIDNVKQDSTGDQTLVIDDDEREIELNADNDDDVSYIRGNKVRIKVMDYGSSLSKGKHHLSDTLSQKQHNSFSSKIINVSYEIEKID